MADEILSLPEAAALLGVSRQTAHKLAREGELQAFRVGRAWRVPRSAVEAWYAQAFPWATPPWQR